MIVGIAVYFVMGMVIMRVKYNATGVDLIPNKAFWKSLPGLIKVGFVCVLSLLLLLLLLLLLFSVVSDIPFFLSGWHSTSILSVCASCRQKRRLL